MTGLEWHPSLLSESQIETVHQAAVDLASRVGLLVQHRGLLDRLAGQEGVRIDGQRVHFRADRIEESLGLLRYPPIPEPDRYATISGAYIIGVQDLETGAVRESTQQDLVDLTILGEQLGFCGSPAVRPLDLPTPLQEIAMYKTVWEYSADRPEPLFDTTPLSSAWAAEVICEMAQAIGKPFSVGMYLISPFTCPPEGLEVIAAFLDRQVPMWIGTMPVAGLNAPVFMLGAHVQALAELMAGSALLHTLTGGQVPVYWTPIDSVRAHPFDMRHATFVFGSAEDQVGTVLQAQINRRYGVPVVAKSLLTTAHEPDEQAAAEKASHTLLAALAGARMFTNAGFLAVDYYVSPVQMVIDREIVDYVRHVVAGVPVDEAALAVSVIGEAALSGGDYLGHPSTLQNFRAAAWDPPLFTHVGYSAGGGTKNRPLLERAQAAARSHIAAGDYVLGERDRALLDAIFRRAWQEQAGN